MKFGWGKRETKEINEWAWWPIVITVVIAMIIALSKIL